MLMGQFTAPTACLSCRQRRKSYSSVEYLVERSVGLTRHGVQQATRAAGGVLAHVGGVAGTAVAAAFGAAAAAAAAGGPLLLRPAQQGKQEGAGAEDARGGWGGGGAFGPGRSASVHGGGAHAALLLREQLGAQRSDETPAPGSAGTEHLVVLPCDDASGPE